MNDLKLKVAQAAVSYVQDHTIIGVGSGSTVNFFIEALAKLKPQIDACVASSKETERRLRQHGLPVIDLNVADHVPIYIDGADEINAMRQMIKGGGGALTREKIIATAATEFICIVDESKMVEKLGDFPVAIEVLPIARSLVGRAIVRLNGDPIYRDGFKTDNGNIIIDVFGLDLKEAQKLEDQINCIPGVVENGIFAHRTADKVLIARQDGVIDIIRPLA